MKKALILTILSSIITLTASAQVWIGGELFFKSTKAKLGDLELNSNKSVGIMPEVGYRLNDKWAVALKIGYAHHDNGAVSLTNQTITGMINEFSITPFVRYTLFKADKFSFMLDGGISYRNINITDYEPVKSFDIAVSPALSYDLNHHWALTAHLGRIGYNHLWTDIRNDKFRNNEFEFSIFDGLTFGLNYRF